MIRRFPILATLLLLIACGREPAPEAQPAPSATGNRPVTPAAAAIIPPGEYRMAGFDGQEVNLPHGITVSVTADTISVASQCVAPRWSYTIEGARMVTAPTGEPICARALFPPEEAFFAVLAAPQSVTRTPANGLDVAGGGHTITLFTQ